MINDDLPIGSTPLSADDANGLIPKGVLTRGQLNQFESRNIQDAVALFMTRQLDAVDILTVGFCLKLHKKMLNKTWKWAGQFRRYEVNIGNAPPTMISMSLRNLCDDAKYWIQHNTYPIDEICIRFHHKMVWIHPFANGNGRHSRIMADVLMKALEQQRFTWGEASLTALSNTRLEYISALRAADKGDYSDLFAFARS